MNTQLVCGWPKSATVKDTDQMLGTWAPLYKRMVWSWNACFQGVHPSKDWDGNPLPTSLQALAGQPLVPSGHRIVIWSLLGDHEYMANVLRLPHWAAHQWCWVCNAHSQDPTRDWRELRQASRGWQLRTAAEEHRERLSPHPFFTLPGVTTFSISLDALHILYCKGVFSIFFGSWLHTVCWKGTGRQHVAPAVRLARLFSMQGAGVVQSLGHHQQTHSFAIVHGV